MMLRLFLLILLMFPVSARGSIPAPNSSVTASADGRRVLVMVSPMPEYDREPTATLSDGRVVDVHHAFGMSGVYDASTLEPVWQVDWFALRHDLMVSDDLRHVAWFGRRGMHTGWALAFYEDGGLVRLYNCGQLLTGLRGDRFLPFTSGDWHTEWYEDFGLSADRRTVLVSTMRRRAFVGAYRIDLGLQEFYAFDLTNGAMVSRRVEGRWVVWAYAAGAVAVCVVGVGLVRAIWRRVKRGDRRRGFAVVVAGGDGTAS
jgi:hypothetical protein